MYQYNYSITGVQCWTPHGQSWDSAWLSMKNGKANQDVAAPGDWLRDPQRGRPREAMAKAQEHPEPGCCRLPPHSREPKGPSPGPVSNPQFAGPWKPLAGDLASECLLAFSLTASRPKHEKTRWTLFGWLPSERTASAATNKLYMGHTYTYMR